jgi:hypothetical protein
VDPLFFLLPPLGVFWLILVVVYLLTRGGVAFALLLVVSLVPVVLSGVWLLAVAGSRGPGIKRYGKPLLLLEVGVAVCLLLLPLRWLASRDSQDRKRLKERFAQSPVVYLADLKPTDVNDGPWPVSMDGTLGDPQGGLVRVNGHESPKGIAMHPPDKPSYASATFRIYGLASAFRASVALNDSANWIASSATFLVLGDGRVLWEAKPVNRAGQVHHVHLDVTGVDELELRVQSRGSHRGLHAVWIEPRLLQPADAPDPPWPSEKPPERVEIGPGDRPPEKPPVKPPEKQPGDPPSKPPAEEGPATYLADLDEFDVKNGPWKFTKDGTLGDPFNNRIKVKGRASPHGLSMHPPDQPGHAAASFRLGKKHATFRAQVALDDNSGVHWNGAVFGVVGDGKLLWKSRPVTDPGKFQEVTVDVSKVDVLELRVVSERSHFGVHAVWVEPHPLKPAKGKHRKP